MISLECIIMIVSVYKLVDAQNTKTLKTEILKSPGNIPYKKTKTM